MIHKYTLVGRNVVSTLAVPRGARVLSAAMQDQSLRVWIEVDPLQDPVNRLFAVIGTGVPFDAVWSMLPSSRIFVGTVIEGPWVWHVYDLGERAQ